MQLRPVSRLRWQGSASAETQGTLTYASIDRTLTYASIEALTLTELKTQGTRHDTRAPAGTERGGFRGGAHTIILYSTNTNTNTNTILYYTILY